MKNENLSSESFKAARMDEQVHYITEEDIKYQESVYANFPEERRPDVRFIYGMPEVRKLEQKYSSGIPERVHNYLVESDLDPFELQLSKLLKLAGLEYVMSDKKLEKYLANLIAENRKHAKQMEDNLTSIFAKFKELQDTTL